MGVFAGDSVKVTPSNAHWTIPSICSLNINSLRATKAGGITENFGKVLKLVISLLNIYPILCLQDIRLPDDKFISCLKPVLPGHSFFTSAHGTASGGVVTIVNDATSKGYDVYPDTIYQGYIISTRFTHKLTNNQFTVLNTYLHASNETTWMDQITAIKSLTLPRNTIIVGDFNHASDDADRSGFHADKSKTARKLFNQMLTDHHLEEVDQPLHTFYGMRDTCLTSSRIDRIFHNMCHVTVARQRPAATVITTAPYTVASYGLTHRDCSDWRNIESNTELIDRQVIRSFPTVKNGGSHVTDHLPIAIRFSGSSKLSKRSFLTHTLGSNTFDLNFQQIWDATLHADDWSSDLPDLKKSLCTASYRSKGCSTAPPEKNSTLWEAVRLINAIDLNDPTVDIDTRFSHIPEYLNLKGNPNELIDKVNMEFAAIAYDNDSHAPISKIQTIAKSLPNGREKISHLYDEDSATITDNPVTMTKVIKKFWGNKWLCKSIKDPIRLFRIYGKTIHGKPLPVTLDLVSEVILNTNNSSPGPDGIPFAAYRKVIDTAAPIFLSAVLGLMAGEPTPPGFNSGILHLLPKKANDRIEDTRPLVVNNTDNRIIAAVIQRSIFPSIDPMLSDNQHGFRPDRSTHENVDFFNEKFFSAKEKGEFYDILFVDFQKAFDSISHEALFKLLSAIGLPQGHVTAIKSLFHHAYCMTNVKGADPERIYFHSGVKQGCPLSPTLFLLMADVLTNMLESIPGLDIKLYADDTAIGCDNIIPKLPILKRVFETFKKYTGLEMNPSKSAVVATGGRSDLRIALDNVGWPEVRISGNERYLGTYIGHETTLDDIFRSPYEKLKKRVALFTQVKENYSLQSRVIIWNTWLLPIFSYTFCFHSIPTDYLDWVDNLCIRWLAKGTTMKFLYLSRPTHLAGLTTPLRDTTIDNYSKLATRASIYDRTDPNSPVWSMRVRTHRNMARDFLANEYSAHLSDKSTSASLYNIALHSTSSTLSTSYTNYIGDRLQLLGTNNTAPFYSNYKTAPRWIPSYVRVTCIGILHNALFTATRLQKDEYCYLCGDGDDDIKHIWGCCPTTSAAHAKFWGQLGHNRDNISLLGAIAADCVVDAATATAQFFLTDSIWRARCNSYQGDDRPKTSWASWIVDNALTRISKSCPSFFNINFPLNKVPLRIRITYGANIGSSKNADSKTKKCAKFVVNKAISSLPDGSLYAFTDGSASPNPGPTGAGALIYQKGVRTDTVLHTFSAAIGPANNNTGELFAVGIVAEQLLTMNHTKDVVIFTDSSLVIGALTKNWDMGASNRKLLDITRKLVELLKCKLKFKWVPGHSGIEQNESADLLAGAGASYSADNCFVNNSNNLGSMVATSGFRSFLINFQTSV